MIKLKGSRLEAEVDRVRTDGNWKRLSELLPSVKSKNSGLEDSFDLFQAEIILETFLEQLGEVLRPHKDHLEKLHNAEQLLITVIKEKTGNASVYLEANILLAKLEYACVEYRKALTAIEMSGMEKGNTPFRTLRALRLVAEGYAIKGLCLESMENTREHSWSVTSNISTNSSSQNEIKALNCFEKSAELAISYINELEKALNNSTNGNKNITGGIGSGGGTKQQEKIGEILERCLERVAVLRAKDTVAQRKNGSEGIEWYRKIITCLGDKSTGERLQQKLSRQLAELLIRATVPTEEKSMMSEALSVKSQNLSFYTGSNRAYFAPSSRIEEVVLLLLISEVLSTREVVLSRSDDLSNNRTQSLQNAKSVFNLLTLVLSTLRQYHILATIYERAMKFANNDSFLWQQFALSSICRGRFTRAARVLEQSIITTSDSGSSSSNNENVEKSENGSSLHLTNNPSCALSIISEYMLLSQINIERFANFSAAKQYSKKAIELCSKDGQLMFLRGRCLLIHAIANGFEAQEETIWEQRKTKLSKAVELIEECVAYDPHDYLALYYAAYFHAISRDLESAKDRCSRSLALNNDQPCALMLLALIFTSYGDLKGALELVVNSLNEFENNYGLLVLRLHIETKFGRIEESLDTSTNLLDFWKKRDLTSSIFAYSGGIDEDRSQKTMNGFENVGSVAALGREGSIKGTPSLGGRDANSTTPIGLMSTPSFTTTQHVPLINSLPTNASNVDLSIGDSGVAASEGGQSSTSDSGTIANNSLISSDSWSKFRTQADIWMTLAELYLSEGKLSDVSKCVEQAVVLFPHSPQAMYLKGRLLAYRANLLDDQITINRIRGEAKAALLSALAIAPSHSSSLSALANMYSDEGNLKMAEHMLREMVRDDPLNCEWWQQLGCCLMKRGDAERATECLTAAANLDRSTPLLPFSIIPLMEQEACLSIGDDEEEGGGCYSMDGVAMSVGAYFKQVRETRKITDDVVRVDIEKVAVKKNQNKEWEGTKGLNMRETVVQCQPSLIPSKEWQEAKSLDFARKREKIEEIRKNRQIQPIKMKFPDLSNEDEWHRLLLEQCSSQVSEIKSKFENHVGTPPALSVVFSFSPKIVNELLPYLVEWSEEEGLTRPIREWIYALMLVVQLPLLPDVIDSLRKLVKICKKTRSSLPSDRILAANEFSMFISIVTSFFVQKDLAD